MTEYRDWIIESVDSHDFQDISYQLRIGKSGQSIYNNMTWFGDVIQMLKLDYMPAVFICYVI